ncbi:MAG: type II secretion system protein GspG [bacterium JZ-2024 1]
MRPIQKGFTLIELMAASAIAVILFSVFMGAYATVVQHYAVSELPQRGDQLATAMYYYYLDTGTYPPGSDSAGLANLVTNNAGVNGWRGPYLRLQMEDGTLDPWGRPFIYRRGTTPSGQPVFLLLSLGRNGRLDSNLSGGIWTHSQWDPSGDDWGRVFSERAPISYYEEKTYNTLRFVAGMIYNANPGMAPTNFNTGRYRDAWGRSVVYQRCNQYSAVVYSLGANGSDNSASGATICSTARKQRDDLYVALVWNGDRPRSSGNNSNPPGGGGNGDQPRDDVPDTDDCLRWLPPPWQPTPPGGNGNQPPWQEVAPNGRNTSPPWQLTPPGRPWRDPQMPCRGVDFRQPSPGNGAAPTGL